MYQGEKELKAFRQLEWVILYQDSFGCELIWYYFFLDIIDGRFKI